MISSIIDKLFCHQTICLTNTNESAFEDTLNTIINNHKQGYTSNNGHQDPTIVVQNKEKKNPNLITKFSKVRNGFQQYIANVLVFILFVIDFYKAYLISWRDLFPKITNSISGISTRSVYVGITFKTIVTAMANFRSSIICIATVRNNTPNSLVIGSPPPEYTFSFVNFTYPIFCQGKKKIQIYQHLYPKTSAHPEFYYTEKFNDFNLILNQYNQQIPNILRKNLGEIT